MELTKTKFKQTEVGLIPEDWGMKSIDEVFKFYPTSSFAKAEMAMEGKVGCLHYGLIHSITNANFSLENGVKFYVSKEQARYELLKDGDVVMVDASEDYEGINKSIEVNRLNGKEFIAGLHTFLLRDSKNQLADNFRGLILNSWAVKNQMLRLAVGLKVYGVSKNQLKQIFLPIPTLTEQKAIATALSDVDELIAKLEKLIEKKKAIKQGAMQALLTPKEDWKEFSIFELADNRKDLFDDGDWIEAEHITDSGIRLIQTGNIGVGVFKEKDAKKYIYEESFNRLNCKLLQTGDLLICRLADPAGRACIFPEIGERRVITSVDVTIFRPVESKVNRIFLMNVLSTPNWFKQVTERVGGTTHKRISRGALGKLKVKLPSIYEQNATAEILSDVDNEITAYEKAKSKIERLKQGMMQELLTGKTRLV